MKRFSQSELKAALREMNLIFEGCNKAVEKLEKEEREREEKREKRKKEEKNEEKEKKEGYEEEIIEKEDEPEEEEIEKEEESEKEVKEKVEDFEKEEKEEEEEPDEMEKEEKIEGKEKEVEPEEEEKEGIEGDSEKGEDVEEEEFFDKEKEEKESGKEGEKKEKVKQIIKFEKKVKSIKETKNEETKESVLGTLTENQETTIDFHVINKKEIGEDREVTNTTERKISASNAKTAIHFSVIGAKQKVTDTIARKLGDSCTENCASLHENDKENVLEIVELQFGEECLEYDQLLLRPRQPENWEAFRESTPLQLLIGRQLHLPCDRNFGCDPRVPSSPEECNPQERLEAEPGLCRHRINNTMEERETRSDTRVTEPKFPQFEKVWSWKSARRKRLSPQLWKPTRRKRHSPKLQSTAVFLASINSPSVSNLTSISSPRKKNIWTVKNN